MKESSNLADGSGKSGNGGGGCLSGVLNPLSGLLVWGGEGGKGTGASFHPMLQRVHLHLELAEGYTGRIRGTSGEGEAVAVEEIEERGMGLRDRVRDPKSRVKRGRWVDQEARCVSPLLENDAIRVAIKGELTAGDNVTVFVSHLLINEGHGP